MYVCVPFLLPSISNSNCCFLGVLISDWPGGWDRFSAQDKYSVGGFYFMCPDMVRLMLDKAGLRVVHEGEHDPSNSYYNR